VNYQEICCCNQTLSFLTEALANLTRSPHAHPAFVFRWMFKQYDSFALARYRIKSVF